MSELVQYEQDQNTILACSECGQVYGQTTTDCGSSNAGFLVGGLVVGLIGGFLIFTATGRRFGRAAVGAGTREAQRGFSAASSRLEKVGKS